MLNKEEKILLDIFIECYQLNINNTINYNKNNLNIKLDNIHIPDKIINIFLKKSKYYLNLILESSLIYSIGCDERDKYIKFISFIDYYKENINNIELLSKEFKRLIVYKSIQYLLDKKNNNVDLIKIDEIKEKYLDLFKYINNNIHIYTTNDLEKNIIYKIMIKYELSDIEKTINELLLSNKYDEDIKVLSNNFLKKDKDILYFKHFIIRKMLFDTYIKEYIIKEESYKELEEPNNNLILNIVKKTFKTPFDIYINNCLEINKFPLPQNKELLSTIINRYAYCFYYSDKESEYIKKLNKTEENTLKKIHPFYKVN